VSTRKPNMMKWTLIVLAGLAMATASVSTGLACSCRPQSPDAYVKQADTVFLGRPSKPVVKGKRMTLVFHVFLALKGKPGRNAVLPYESPSVNQCAPEFKAGETVLVFVRKGRTELCDGNYGLSAMLPDFAKYVMAARAKTSAASISMFKAALESTLKPYLHKRRVLKVAYSPLKGKAFVIGGTRFIIVGKSAKAAITVSHGISAGPVTFVSGRFAQQGVNFHALIGARKRGFEVLGKHVVETKRAK
jgi:hypothetical protein